MRMFEDAKNRRYILNGSVMTAGIASVLPQYVEGISYFSVVISITCLVISLIVLTVGVKKRLSVKVLEIRHQKNMNNLSEYYSIQINSGESKISKSADYNMFYDFHEGILTSFNNNYLNKKIYNSMAFNRNHLLTPHVKLNTLMETVEQKLDFPLVVNNKMVQDARGGKGEIFDYANALYSSFDDASFNESWDFLGMSVMTSGDIVVLNTEYSTSEVYEASEQIQPSLDLNFRNSH